MAKEEFDNREKRKKKRKISTTPATEHTQNSNKVFGKQASTNVDKSNQCDEIDTNQVLDFFFVHKKEYAVDLLREHEIDASVSWAKSKLRERVKAAILCKELPIEAVLDKLTEIEGWGNQYIYFYKLSDDQLELWQNFDGQNDLLTEMFPDVVNASTFSPYLPKTPELASMEFDEHKFRAVFVLKREWEERVTGADHFDAGIEYRAYKKKIARAVAAIEIDMTSGLVTLSIPRIETKRERSKIARIIKNEVADFLDFSNCDPIDLSPANPGIRKLRDIMNRQVVTRTKAGSTSKHLSRNRKSDLLKDQEFKTVFGRLKKDNEFGNYYLKEGGEILTDLHFKIQPKPSRLGIFGQRHESEVRHVITMVRRYLSL